MLQLSQRIKMLRSKAKFAHVVWEPMAFETFIDVGFYYNDGSRVYLRMNKEEAESMGSRLLKLASGMKDELR